MGKNYERPWRNTPVVFIQAESAAVGPLEPSHSSNVMDAALKWSTPLLCCNMFFGRWRVQTCRLRLQVMEVTRGWTAMLHHGRIHCLPICLGPKESFFSLWRGISLRSSYVMVTRRQMWEVTMYKYFVISLFVLLTLERHVRCFC